MICRQIIDHMNVLCDSFMSVHFCNTCNTVNINSDKAVICDIVNA